MEVEMYECERCGSRFSPIRVNAGADCPRCRARDGVTVPLTLTLFAAASKVASEKQASGRRNVENPTEHNIGDLGQ
jgi:uncharacterized OB-fold protein